MKRSVGAVVVALISVVALAGCTIDRGDSGAGEQGADREQAAVVEKLPPAISVEDGAQGVSPAKAVTVKALDGTLTDVQMTNQDGKVIQGEISPDNKSWTTSEVLGYYRTYTVTAEGSNGALAKSVFTTQSPAGTAYVALSPLEGMNVGVGQSIGMRFSSPIQDRKAAQEAITITTEPKVEGAFYWLNDYELRWRPQNYWNPGTSVSVKADIYGVDLGGGVYGSEDNATSFNIVGGYTAVVDDSTKTMSIYDGDAVIKTMPVSLGSSQWPTPNGVYIIGDSYPEMVMDSTTYGLALDAGGYKTKVQYATQMSYSGIFVHAAPWSVWAQGSQNTSHGCINVSTENAAWFQQNFKRGDIVTVKNTIGGTLSGYDGLGDWNIPWEEWSAGNA
ncbi:L,D-transpeptidase [Corynebacterium hindlerae]|uniref:L,D-transpeptidase n=1 Tax=Corynebacterium hindlerae TaxID=699041 RepID=A0A7G5FDQ4_9CORY|nr:Ig-like domain-containing protein [Corynebacterium hindlerae]QMV84745.1 L,D-transpeptidase [Corynebacterium hindlerae]